MRKVKDFYIIGIDHGYGNIKTANCCFPTGVVASDTVPTFTGDLLRWNNKYYSIGVGHKEFLGDKFMDNDYYVLTLASIARELKRERITTAKVFIAAGLPLSWVGRQKKTFIKYLLQNRTVSFSFRKVQYQIEIIGADVYPQGYAAIVERMEQFNGSHMICDIGNGTLNLLRLENQTPDIASIITEKYGVYQCMLAIREQMMRIHHAVPSETAITNILKKGKADIAPDYLETIVSTAREYTAGIFRILRERGYDPKLMNLYVVGGGGCLIKNFGEYDKRRVFINPDICANAKGYEYMALAFIGKEDEI